MYAIARSENRSCDPLNHNLKLSEAHSTCVGSYNVLQVGCVHYGQHDDPDDLSTNVRIAYRVWKSQGYNAWTDFRNNNYKRFLQDR